MTRNTSITLGDHFESFIAEQISAGRYGSVSEEHEQTVQSVRQALIAGEQSGDAGALDMKSVRAKARKQATMKRVNA